MLLKMAPWLEASLLGGFRNVCNSLFVKKTQICHSAIIASVSVAYQ